MRPPPRHSAFGIRGARPSQRPVPASATSSRSARKPWPSSLPRNSSTALRAAMTTMTVCKLPAAASLAGRGRQDVHRPDNLRDRHRRQFFQLQLHHRQRFVEIAFGQFDDAQKNTFRRQPRDVQPRLPQRTPGFRHEPGRHGSPTGRDARGSAQSRRPWRRTARGGSRRARFAECCRNASGPYYKLNGDG